MGLGDQLSGDLVPQSWHRTPELLPSPLCPPQQLKGLIYLPWDQLLPKLIPQRVSAHTYFSLSDVSQGKCFPEELPSPDGMTRVAAIPPPKAIPSTPSSPVTLQHLHPMGHFAPITAQTHRWDRQTDLSLSQSWA